MKQRCRVCDELGVRYLLALDELKAARQVLAFSVTQTQRASAKSLLTRVEGHMEHARKELAAHYEWAGSTKQCESTGTCSGSALTRTAA